MNNSRNEPVAPVSARINCGVAFRSGQGFGAYSVMIKVGDDDLPVLDGTVEEGATFIRCAMAAAAEGLESLPEDGLSVEVVTPSSYVAGNMKDVDGLIKRRKSDWESENGDSVVHVDLWERILDSVDRHASVNFILDSEVGAAARRSNQKAGEAGSEVSDGSANDGALRRPDCEISYNVATAGNSGVGAYVIVLDFPGRSEEFSTKFQTTNYARMHLMACLDALKTVRDDFARDGLRIVLNTPHDLIANSVNQGWLDRWSQDDWKRRDGDRVRNADLWQVFRRRISRHDVEVRLAMDMARSDELATKADQLVHKENEKVEEDAGFTRSEEEDVAAGRTIRLYTDGAALENPGPGGWGAIMEFKGRTLPRSQGFVETTNNRMELMGPVVALEELVALAGDGKLSADTKVIVVTDSAYVVDAMTRGWAKKWRKNSWIKQNDEKAANIDLWKRMLHANDRLKSLEFRWVRGHAGHRHNERCDALARKAAGRATDKLLVDEGYLSGSE